MVHTIELKNQSPDNPWIEIFPSGVSIEAAEFANPNRPVMFFKDKKNVHTLPVWLSPVEAGIVLSENSQKVAQSSPHFIAHSIFNKMNLKITHCIFTELRGHYQYVKVFIEGSDELKSIEVRADQAISFCISAKAKFYCKKDFIKDCKVLDASLFDLPSHQHMKSRISSNLKNKYLN